MKLSPEEDLLGTLESQQDCQSDVALHPKRRWSVKTRALIAKAFAGEKEVESSGGFTPCRHLRPSSGREHTIVTYSVQ